MSSNIFDNVDQQQPPVLVIAGYGPSIGESTAREFASSSKEGGYQVACLGRTKEKLDDGVQRLQSTFGIMAVPFVVDCGNSQEVQETIKKIQSQMGTISVILWNAASYSGGDFMSEEDPASILNQIVSVGCGGLLSCVQAAYDDLKKSKGTVLITGGGLSTYDTQVDEIAVENNWMGLAFCKSSQRKLAGLLHARLKPDDIMVGTVVISGPVKIGGGKDVTDPNNVAKEFWNIHQQRPNTAEIHLGSLQPLALSSTSDTT